MEASQFDLIVLGSGSAARERRRDGCPRLRCARGDGRAGALGRQLPDRRVQADEGVPGRRRSRAWT
jgi:hypothetical protein